MSGRNEQFEAINRQRREQDPDAAPAPPPPGGKTFDPFSPVSWGDVGVQQR